MPYIKLQTVDGQPVELSGNNEKEISAAITKHGKIAAVDAANAFVTLFFQRRRLVIDRQKLLQLGKEDQADELQDKIDELEDQETAARDTYFKAAARGPAADATDADAANKTATTSSKPGNAYGAAFDQLTSAPPSRPADDDFM